MKQEERIDEVDILRGLAAILMILGHSFIVYPIDISGVPWCKAVQHFIYTFHMELFFILAGVVYRCQSYGTFIVGKVKRILIPYIFWGIFAMLCRALGGVFVNGVEPIGQGVFKLLFLGGGYWFLYVSFLLFAIYPFIEKVFDRPWKKAVFAGIVLILTEMVRLPSIFMLDTLGHHIPYFVFGDCVKPIISGGGYNRKKRVYSCICSLIIYCGIDVVEILGIYEVRNILSFVRAVAISVFLYLCMLGIKGLWNTNRVLGRVHDLLVESGKLSLQLYLFNGYLLTFFRILICSVLHISSPLIIVLGIWIGDVAVTLIVCKWIVLKMPVFCFCCGMKSAKRK